MRQTYLQRNILLVELGFKTYEDYLLSNLWKRIRAKVLDRDERECRLCGVTSYMVHHLDYKKDTLLGKSFTGLVTICQLCHNKVEFNRYGEKRSLSDAKSTYKRMSRLPKTEVRRQNQARKSRRLPSGPR